MPSETGAMGAQGQASEGVGPDKLDGLMNTVTNLSGVVSELATKFSDMERTMADSRELDAILRTAREEANTEEPPPPTQPGNGSQSTKAMIDEVVNRIDKVNQTRFSKIEQRVNDMLGSLEVKQISMSDPEFDKNIRPKAFALSKQADKQGWSIQNLVDHARGNLALERLKAASSEIAQLKEKLADAESRAVSSDRPGYFTAVTEPTPDMSDEEAFNRAWKESGMSVYVKG